MGGSSLIPNETNVAKSDSLRSNKRDFFSFLSKAPVVNLHRNYRYSLAVGFAPSRVTAGHSSAVYNDP